MRVSLLNFEGLGVPLLKFRRSWVPLLSFKRGLWTQGTVPTFTVCLHSAAAYTSVLFTLAKIKLKAKIPILFLYCL